MNFLAHIFLSGENENVQLGNFIADEIKGNKYHKYNIDIQKGILLHREIDFFTDNHKYTREIKFFFRKDYGLFSGIIVDIFFDYLLSINWNKFTSINLEIYISNFYNVLIKNSNILPPKISTFYNIMIKENWLLMYSSLYDLEIILNRMGKRLNINNLGNSVRIMEENIELFEPLFLNFWKDLNEYIK